MAITFDPKKSAKNVAERGLSFELAEKLEWNTALVRHDTRKDYGEIRLQVTAMIDDHLYLAVVTPRDGDLRIISLRRASKREAKIYGKKN